MPVSPATDPSDSDLNLRVGKPSPRRVLHVINGEHFSGAERVQDLLGLRLPEFSFDAGFVALKRGRFGDVRQSIQSPLHELDMASKWDLRAVGKVVQIIREGNYELVHAHTPRSALIGSLAAKRAGVPFVFHVHSPTSRDSTRRIANWVNNVVESWSLRAASKLITVSPTLTEHMQSLGVPSDKITCVLNGVPAIEGAVARRQPGKTWTLGMVALFRPRKGPEVLLEAVAALRSQGHDVRLRMIGPFETEAYETELMAKVDQLKLSDAVDWTGFTPNAVAELEQVDALALPSLFGEGLPMVVLEAMAAGLPVVATHCEGVAQAVVPGETGLLVEAGSVDQLTDAIGQLVGGELECQQLSQASISRHAERFSDRVMAGQVAAVYAEILGVQIGTETVPANVSAAAADQRAG